MSLTWDDLDGMVEGDPLVMRDRVWAELGRLDVIKAVDETFKDRVYELVPEDCRLSDHDVVEYLRGRLGWPR